MDKNDYESHFLLLASCTGCESLRQKCPCISSKGRVLCTASPYCDFCGETCCQGRGWLPLPEVERVGALVEMLHELGEVVVIKKQNSGLSLVSLGRLYREAPTLSAALTAALLDATEPQP